MIFTMTVFKHTNREHGPLFFFIQHKVHEFLWIEKYQIDAHRVTTLLKSL